MSFQLSKHDIRKKKKLGRSATSDKVDSETSSMSQAQVAARSSDASPLSFQVQNRCSRLGGQRRGPRTPRQAPDTPPSQATPSPGQDVPAARRMRAPPPHRGCCVMAERKCSPTSVPEKGRPDAAGPSLRFLPLPPVIPLGTPRCRGFLPCTLPNTS